MSADPHIAPVVALLEAHPNLGAGANSAPVYTEKVPDGTSGPYVKLYISVRYRGGDHLPNRSSRAIGRIVTHSVGLTANAAHIVAGNVREALLDVRPTVAGRRCQPIRQEQSIDPQPDESTGVLVMDQVDVWRLESLPG